MKKLVLMLSVVFFVLLFSVQGFAAEETLDLNLSSYQRALTDENEKGKIDM